jgi:hypothetical protein
MLPLVWTRLDSCGRWCGARRSRARGAPRRTDRGSGCRLKIANGSLRKVIDGWDVLSGRGLDRSFEAGDSCRHGRLADPDQFRDRGSVQVPAQVKPHHGEPPRVWWRTACWATSAARKAVRGRYNASCSTGASMPIELRKPVVVEPTGVLGSDRTLPFHSAKVACAPIILTLGPIEHVVPREREAIPHR